MLTADTAAWLAPYLAYTRATHLDLLDIASGAPEVAVGSFRRAEALCGEKLLREIFAEIGWTRLNFGLELRRFIGTSVAGSFPLLVAPEEAALLDDCEGTRRTFDRFLVIAHGGAAHEPASSSDTAIARFRAYNLAHADLLGGFLDVTPLTHAKVRLTLERMDRIVADFQFLFAGYTDECPVLADIYGSLRESIERALAAEPPVPGQPLSPELTRLVDMFDDPQSLPAVRTLHGLKRYLHQRGLKLGMRLAESGRAANRTISLALATAGRVLQVSHAIEYVDFESDNEIDGAPYPVRLVIEEFGRQLVHCEQKLPKVKVFCYGNEVHYFVAYKNHPAFVRIDFSPPSRGGMIDLAYFGVSKYELSLHPNPSLGAIDRLFRRLDFDVLIDNTHVHARYDKERAFDLGDLCAKAASLFRLAPYLMDLDWVIGDLALAPPARDEVADAWASFFASWGVLPYEDFLTPDRRGILAALEARPEGEQEVRWSGTGPYRDRFTIAVPPAFRDELRSAFEARGLGRFLTYEEENPLSQLMFETHVLNPLRDAIRRGEIAVDGDSVRRCPSESFALRHPAECLAAVLRADEGTIADSARLAGVVALLARGLRFRTAGTINGYDVQHASLPLPGRTSGLYALRDGSGIVRLAIHADGDSLYVRRKGAGQAWQTNWSTDPEALSALLRHANYPVSAEIQAEDPADVAPRIAAMFRGENPHAALPPLPGERLVAGLTASPGRAVGIARLGLANRRPADLEAAIIVCASLSPADSAFLVHSAGVVSTGGGALSHAGLLALQFGKPALIVGGTWERGSGNEAVLSYRLLQYDELRHDDGAWRITERHHIRERGDLLHDGDLVVVDADEGVLRVLGQEPDALALHESLRQLVTSSRRLHGASSDSEILVERGRRLRARHQLERIASRLADPVLARHAVTELLLGRAASEVSVAAADKGKLLGMLAANRSVGELALRAVLLFVTTLTRRLAADFDRAMQLIGDSTDSCEILSLRLGVRRSAEILAETRALVAAGGIAVACEEPREIQDLEEFVTGRLEILRAQLMNRAESTTDPARRRHLVERIERIDEVLGAADDRVSKLRSEISSRDEAALGTIAMLRIIDGRAGGIEIRPISGTKAANLAEIARLGEGSLVPPWFVVTDHAFREALESPCGDPTKPATVRSAIERVLGRSDLDHPQKAAAVRHAWESAQFPDALEEAVKRAYRELSPDGAGLPFVAVRSSASEEDLESATRAGEFDTFLFVRGEDALVAHLKLAWSGLWNERALHARDSLGGDADIGGGVIVQAMITARASGVLHTINVAGRRLREMVINAGLGLGEGIVSGAVAADQIVVSKEGDLQRGELRFRYVTADKRERVVFNSRVGSGTARVETLYHQRLRPALEYVEICELVRAAARLESAYGYPLDIEFAIEGTSVYLLQARPIPTPFTVWRETRDRYPLRGAS